MSNRINYLFRNIIAILVIICTFNMSELLVNAEEISLESLYANVELDGYSYVVEWQYKELENKMEYYLYLPNYFKNNQIRIYFEGPETILLNEYEIKSGDIAEDLNEGYNIVTCGTCNYDLIILYGSDIPIVRIETESGGLGQLVWEKDYRESGTVTIIRDGETVCSEKLEYIKGRGNSTWKLDKKPFNFKFDRKISLFDMGKAKKWCLLANYLDPTLIKNKLACDFANVVGLNYSPESILVDLYINEQYMGNYTLMEDIEIGDARIDITDLEKLNEKANPDINIKESETAGVRGRESYAATGSYKWAELRNIPEIVTGGYLLEFELAAKYDSEPSGFVSEYGQPVIIKSPEYAAKEQVEYIKNYYQEFENAVLSGDGYNSIGKHFTEYIDLESFAKMYVFQEFVKNLDAGITSCYFYKDVGGKIVAGPVWDFDSSFGRDFGRDGVDMKDPIGLWVTEGYLHEELKDKYTIFSLLCRHNIFREEAKIQWKQCFEPNVEKLLNNAEKLWNINNASIVSDLCKWGSTIETGYNAINILNEQNIGDLKNFISKRCAYMSEVFSEETCTIEYNSNGGSGSMYDLNFYKKGSCIELQENVYQNTGRKFLGWNTKISGWGNHYEDGELIAMNESITLYAQWGNPTLKEKIQKTILGIMGK